MAFILNSKNFSSYSKEIKACLIRYFYVTALVVLPIFYDLFSHLFLDERITLGRLINMIICVVLLYFYFLVSIDSKILNLGKSHAYKVKLKDLAKSIRLPLHHIQTKQKRLASQIDSNHLKEKYTGNQSNTPVNETSYAKDAYDHENTSALDPTYNSNSNFNCNPSASDSHTATFNPNPFDNYLFDKEANFDAISIADPQNSNYQSTYSLIDELERNCDKYLAKDTSPYTSPTTIADEKETAEAAATAEAFAITDTSSSTVTVAARASSLFSSSTPKLSSAAKKFLSTVANGTTCKTATTGTTGTTSTTATTSVTATSKTKGNTHSTRNLFKEDKATKTSIFSPSLFKAKATTNYYLHKDFTPEITYTYLGKGFEFKPDHTRLLNNLLNTGLIFNCNECHGSLQIHELEKHNDKSLFTLTSNLKGHTIIFGTTGSGKTRAFDLFISQAILRNEVVIVIDPKGDRDLKANLYKVAELIGREDSVEVLDLVNLKNTTSSFNLLGSSSKPTQIADRLTSLMSNNKDNDFANYAHQAVAAAVIALCFKQKELNLRNITNHLNLISLFDGVLNFIITFLVKTNNDKLVEVFYCFVKDFKLNFKDFTFGDLLKDKILQLEREKQLAEEFAKVKELRGSSKDKAYEKSSDGTSGDASDDTSLVSEKTDTKDTSNKFSDDQASSDKLSIEPKTSSKDPSFDTDLAIDTASTFDTAHILDDEDGSSTTAKAQDVKDTKDTKTSKGVSKKGSSKSASKKSVTDTRTSSTENTKANTCVNTKAKAAVNAKTKAKASNLGKACKDLKDNKLVDAKEPCDKDTSKGAKTPLKRLSFMDKVSRIEKLCLRLNELDDRFEITSDLETLLRLCKLDATYFAKVTAGIHPILNTLCLSGLDNYLSASHIALTVAQVYKENKILYVALNSLKDTTLATYVGKLLLSDMASTVSDIYSAKENCDINLKISKNKQSYLKTLESNSLQSFDNLFEFQNLKRKIAVFIDEASEIANEPMLQLLNKSRGAEVNITLATQSYADLVKRTGSESSARQIIANCNTKFSLRVKDDETAKVFTNELQYTSIYQKSNAIGQNALSEAITGSDNNSYSKRQTQAELFPPSVLSSLPDFEYVAKLSDGRFVKGVFPILDVESEYGKLNGTNQKAKNEVLSKIKSFFKDAKNLLVFLSVGSFNILKLIFLVLVWPWFRFLLKAIHHFLILPIVGPFIRLFNKNLLLPTRSMVDNRYHSRYKKGFMYFFKSYKFYQDNLAFSRAYTEKLDLGDLEGLKDLTPPEPSLEYKIKALKGGTDYKHTHLDQVKMLVRSYNAFLKE
ncbi:MAG: type IV secretion system DNA-binding domain-containing protein [Succinivibrio sp.]|nr:type IV secretion system DNA-binding domain-containing protein [Succinivibrio sp.]